MYAAAMVAGIKYYMYVLYYYVTGNPAKIEGQNDFIFAAPSYIKALYTVNGRLDCNDIRNFRKQEIYITIHNSSESRLVTCFNRYVFINGIYQPDNCILLGAPALN